VRAGSRAVGDVRVPAALPRAVYAPLLVVSVLAAAAVAVLGVLYAGMSTGTAFDASVRANLLGTQGPWHALALAVDWTGEPYGSLVVLAVLTGTCWLLGRRRSAVLVLAGTGVAVAATTALKPLIGRTINGEFLCFPSGHTATATAYALAVSSALLAGREIRATRGLLVIAAVTVPVAALMAWAQVLLNAHYPTDTIGGFATALAVVPPIAWVIDRVADQLARRRAERLSSAGTP
jgi:membrane-associated phospholipid phosphatase